MKYTPSLIKKNVNVSKESPIREFFILLSGLLSIIMGLYFVLGFAINILVPKISPELENTLGNSLINRFKTEENAEKDVKALQEFADKLHQKCINIPYKFNLHIVKSSQINALALPGGHIVVFSELLNKINSENELAFVLFHEMGHFANRDHLRGIGRSLVFIVITSLLLGPDNQLVNLMVQGIQLGENKFSREQEIAADEFALRNLNCFYGDVMGAADFFNKLADTEEPAGFFEKYYLTHPDSKQRAAHMEDYRKANDFTANGPLLPVPEVFAKQVQMPQTCREAQ